jgi:hypothetical protein
MRFRGMMRICRGEKVPSAAGRIDKGLILKAPGERVSQLMKHRFLLHSLNHTILVVDISQFGMAIEINPRTGNTKMVPALRFINWKEAEQYFRAKEADAETIGRTRTQLSKNSTAVMTIL